ncbi:hypothetical protein [Streptomyces panaciradicis]|uniref:hypothetical protein n=1 Tax=Streptomyces panaciradicis TaxID=1470261 RepID=UPI00201CDA9E|nr:hypothetical protein [Streptomyces panaciradicis]MCL6673158.1 hypothetical protein [Streptomyces panaciradicis]
MTAGWCSRTVRAAVFAAVCVLLAALAHEVMSGGRVPAWALAAGAAATGAAGWCLAGRERGPALIVPVVVGAQAVLHAAFSYARSAAESGGGAPDTMPGMDMGGGASVASMGGTGTGGGASVASMAGMDMGGGASVASMGGMGTGGGNSVASMAGMDMGGGASVASMGGTGTGGGNSVASMAGMDMGGGNSVATMAGMDMSGHGSMGGMHMGHAAGGSPSLGMLGAHLLAALLCGLWLAHGERAAFRILRAVGARLAAPLRLLLVPPPSPHHTRPRFGRPRSDRAPRLLPLVHTITSRGPPVGTAVV